MRILIVAATWMEVKFLIDEGDCINDESDHLKKYNFDGIELDILATGVGTTFTTFHLTTTLKGKDYDLVVNIGIAGSLSKDIKIGDVVNIISDEFVDLGIEKHDEFLTLFEAGFIDPSDFPFENGLLKVPVRNEFKALKKVRGITSSMSHGNEKSINLLRQKFSAQVESMEGAAVFYVCRWLGVDCCQIRAISNYIEANQNAMWNIPLALVNLKETVMDWLNFKRITVNASHYS